MKPPSRHLSLNTDHDEDRELLLPLKLAPPQTWTPLLPKTTTVIKDRNVDRNFDRQVSLLRFSSGNSYTESLFFETTLDDNLSSDVKDTWTKESSLKPVTTIGEIEEVEAKKSKDSLALKSRGSYYDMNNSAFAIYCEDLH